MADPRAARVDAAERFTYRPLGADDLPMLHVWLNEPGVVTWWEGEDVSWESVRQQYGPDNGDPVEHWIAHLDGTPFGWIQCYAAIAMVDEADDEARRWFEIGIDDHAAGIDYLVGDPTRRGGGLGSEMIAAFVEQVVFGMHPDWTEACASPFEANVASWRALEKAGFSHRGTFDDELGPCKLMVRRRHPSR